MPSPDADLLATSSFGKRLPVRQGENKKTVDTEGNRLEGWPAARRLRRPCLGIARRSSQKSAKKGHDHSLPDCAVSARRLHRSTYGTRSLPSAPLFAAVRRGAPGPASRRLPAGANFILKNGSDFSKHVLKRFAAGSGPPLIVSSNAVPGDH